MSKVLVTESYLDNIADAIRLKNGASTTYRPGDMAAAIEALDTSGIHPTGTKNIAQNGTHDVTQYASANVNVQPNLQSKTATQNGTVVPDQGYDGLSSVVVDVSGGGNNKIYLLKSDTIEACAANSGKGYPGAIQYDSILSYSLENYTFDSESVKCLKLRSDTVESQVLSFYQKIKASTYSKLCIKMAANGANSGCNFQVQLRSAPGSTNYQGNGEYVTSEVPSLRFLNSSWTVEQLMAQTRDISLLLSNNVTLPAQTVEIDISDISTDFWAMFYCLGTDVYIREVWAE